MKTKEKTKKIKAGDVVKYRNRKMTVELVGYNLYAVCVWNSPDKAQRQLFYLDQLTSVS